MAFKEIVSIARLNALRGYAVCVLSLNAETHARWLSHVEGWSTPITLLDVLDSNRATLRDWQRYLRAATRPDHPARSVRRVAGQSAGGRLRRRVGGCRATRGDCGGM